MWTYSFQNWFVVLLQLIAGFCLVHLLCSAISDRIYTRSQWPPLGDNNDDDLTNDTGPK